MGARGRSSPPEADADADAPAAAVGEKRTASPVRRPAKRGKYTAVAWYVFFLFLSLYFCWVILIDFGTVMNAKEGN